MGMRPGIGPGFAQSGSSSGKGRFSNGWKKFSESHKGHKEHKGIRGCGRDAGGEVEGNLHEWMECRFADLNGRESGREDIENMKTASRSLKGRREG